MVSTKELLMNQTVKNNYPHQWRAFIGITLLSFGCYLDYTIVNVALPTIQGELHANLSSLQWVMNIYFLSLCILATIMGRCGDLYGRRRVFYIGVCIFALASILAGCAGNIDWLIMGRLLQGVGAAIVFPLGPSLLPEAFPEKDRGKAIAWLGSVGGIALAIGPVLGGLIVTYLGWRWIFFINIPLAIAGYLFCFSVVSESKSAGKGKLDYAGMLLIALSIGGIVLGLIHGQEYGWKNYFTISYLLAGIISGIFLVVIENKKANPLIDFKDFKNSLFLSGISLVFLAGVLSAVGLFFDPLYLQILRGESAQLSGFILFMIPVAVFSVAFFVNSIIHKAGLINTILIGLALGTLASMLQIFFTTDISIIYILISFFILGSMWALGNTVPIIAAQTAVGQERASVATGTIVTMFNVGGSIGLTVAIVLYHSICSYAFRTILYVKQYTVPIQKLKLIQKLITNPADSLHIKMDNMTQNIFHYTFIHGFSGVMCFLFMLSILLLACVFGLSRYRR